MSDITVEQFATDAIRALENLETFWRDGAEHALRSDKAEMLMLASAFTDGAKAVRDLAAKHGIDVSRVPTGEAAGASVCEHAVKEGEWCEECNCEYKAAMADPDNDVS